MNRNMLVLLDKPEIRALVEQACAEREIRFSAFEDLIRTEIKLEGMGRRAGLYDAFDDILDSVKIDE